MPETPLPSIALLHGDDEFAIAEHLADLKQRLGPPDVAFMNITEFEGRNLTLAELRTVCDTLPFLADRRLVIVAGVLGQAGGKEGAARGKLAEGLIDYLPAMPPFTTLVLVESRTLPRNSRLYKALQAAPGAAVQLCNVPRGPALVEWILQRATAAGGVFERAAARALADAVGDEPRTAAQEVEKLLAHVNWERAVTAGDVERLTPSAGQANIFHLVDALGLRNGRQAMSQLQRLLAQPGQEPMAIFGMIVRQYRLLLLTKEILDAGGREVDVKTALKLHPYVAQKMAAQARRYKLVVLEQIYRRLLALDVALKTGTDPTLGLDLLVATLTA